MLVICSSEYLVPGISEAGCISERSEIEGGGSVPIYGDEVESMIERVEEGDLGVGCVREACI